MFLLGKQQIEGPTHMQNEFSRKVCLHQQEHGRKASVENPEKTILFWQDNWKRDFGTPVEPKKFWSFYKADGCQLGVEYPGDDDPGAPIMKGQYWMSNMDISAIELRCREPLALMKSTHVHRHALGTMTVDGIKGIGVANYTGKYVGPQSAIYAKAVRNACESIPGASTKVLETELKDLAAQSQYADNVHINVKRAPVAGVRAVGAAGTSQKFRHYDLLPMGMCVCHDDDSTPEQQWCNATVAKTPKPVDMFNRTKLPEGEKQEDASVRPLPMENEAQARRRKVVHEANIVKADKHWSELARQKNWDAVIADVSVYRYSGVDERTIRAETRNTGQKC